MRVVLTVNAAWNALNFRRPVIEELVRRGDSVTILAPTDHSTEILKELGCHIVDLKMDVGGLSPRQDARLASRLAHHFRTLKPDVVLSYTIKNNIFGALAARRTGVPFLPNVSGLGTGFLSGNALRLVVEGLYRFAFRDLPIVFLQNPDDRALFVDRNLITAAQTRLLPGSGIDLDHFTPAPFPERKRTVFLLIGRLLRDKGVFEYVEAARDLKSRRSDVAFQILGATDTANRSAISQEVLSAWVNTGTIEHLGEHTDVRPFIANADCVVLPSYREGAPRTLLEAASMSRPVIATDVPGCRHVVDNEVTGLLCRARDADDLSGAMQRFLELPRSTRIAMGAAGHNKMAQEYDQSIVVSRYLKAIDLLAQATKPGCSQAQVSFAAIQ